MRIAEFGHGRWQRIAIANPDAPCVKFGSLIVAAGLRRLLTHAVSNW
jgi:hypothetical protein